MRRILAGTLRRFSLMFKNVSQKLDENNLFDKVFYDRFGKTEFTSTYDKELTSGNRRQRTCENT